MTRASADQGEFTAGLTALIPQMRAYARTLCRNTSEGDDLAQDALARAWAARSTFEIGTNLKAWTFTILRNQFYSSRRRSWRAVPLDPEKAERTLVDTNDPMASLELDELRRALGMLPVDQREALILVGGGGFSYEEVSGITGVAIGTVKSRVSRARSQLVTIYAEGALVEDGAPASGAMVSILDEIDDVASRAGCG